MNRFILSFTSVFMFFVFLSINVYSQNRLIIHYGEDSLYLPLSMIDSISFDEKHSDNVTKTIFKPDSVNLPTSHLLGKHLYSIFDSFGATSVWQRRLVDLSGMKFDAIQNSIFSYSNTKTLSDGPTCGMNRAKAFVSMIDSDSEDYLMVENVNDISYLNNSGTINDEPFFLGSISTVPFYGLTSIQDAIQTWNNNFESIVNSFTPEFGKCLMINYEISGQATKLEVLSGPTHDGTLYVTIGNSKYGIDVKEGMSIDEIIDLLLKRGYAPGWTIKRSSSNSVTLVPNSNADFEMGLLINDTGIECNMSSSIRVTSYDRFFVGKNLSDWNNISCWSSIPSLYSIWKGFISYLSSHFPKMHIYLVIPTYYSYDFNNIPQDDNGNYIYTDINNANRIKALQYFEILKDVANLYGIPVLNMEENSGINIYNASNFYYNNNIHPKPEGYYRWAETIYRLLR